jgi:hypothetical protein
VVADLLDKRGNVGERRVRRLRERGKRSAENEGQRGGTKKPAKPARVMEEVMQNISP